MFHTIQTRVYFPYAYGASHICIPVWVLNPYAYGNSYMSMGHAAIRVWAGLAGSQV